MGAVNQPMHHIFTVNEILRAIVTEYAALENNTWAPRTRCTQRVRGLLTLATVKVFSPFALELLWRDASLIGLAPTLLDWPNLAEGQSQTLSSNDYIRFIKVIYPILNIVKQPLELFESLQANDAFIPRSIYCVASPTEIETHEETMDRYGMLLKDSLVDISLYVGADQAFPWSPLLSHLPMGLRQLSILPMVRISKDAEPAPSLTFYETGSLLAAYALRKDTLQTIELRFLHTSMTSMVLERLRRLPHLKNLLLADPRLFTGSSGGDDPLLITEDTFSDNWPSIKCLTVKGYPNGVAATILRASQSRSLTTLIIHTPGESTSTPLSDICDTLAHKWKHSLEYLELTGPSNWHNDPVIDGDRIMQSLATLITLKRLHIDCRHVMSHLHRQHLILIGNGMPMLENIHLTSVCESGFYSSNLGILDLEAFSPLPSLSSVTIEIGNVQNADSNDYHGQISSSKVHSLCILSSYNSSDASRICSSLFPQVKRMEHQYVPHVLFDANLFSN